MIMKGGAGVTDNDGNIVEPLASLLSYWDLDPTDFKGSPRTLAKPQQAKRSWVRRRATATTLVPGEQLTDAFHTRCSPILPCLCGRMASIFCARDPPRTSSAYSITGGTQARQRGGPSSTVPVPRNH